MTNRSRPRISALRSISVTGLAVGLGSGLAVGLGSGLGVGFGSGLGVRLRFGLGVMVRHGLGGDIGSGSAIALSCRAKTSNLSPSVDIASGRGSCGSSGFGGSCESDWLGGSGRPGVSYGYFFPI